MAFIKEITAINKFKTQGNRDNGLYNSTYKTYYTLVSRYIDLDTPSNIRVISEIVDYKKLLDDINEEKLRVKLTMERPNGNKAIYTNLDVNNYTLIELEPIEEELCFEYKLIRMETFRGNILGWNLRLIDGIVKSDIEKIENTGGFRCNSVYHGYPVISLDNIFTTNIKDILHLNYYLIDKEKRTGRAELNLNNMDISNVVTFKEMFRIQSKIKQLNISKWKINKEILVPNAFSCAFEGCNYLESIDLRGVKDINIVKLLSEEVVSKLDKLIINKDTYEILKKNGYRVYRGEEDSENIRVKSKLLGVTEPKFLRNLVIV